MIVKAMRDEYSAKGLNWFENNAKALSITGIVGGTAAIVGAIAAYYFMLTTTPHISVRLFVSGCFISDAAIIGGLVLIPLSVKLYEGSKKRPTQPQETITDHHL